MMKLVFIIFVYQAYLTQKLSVLGLLVLYKYLESFARVVNSPRNTTVTNVCNSHGQKQNKGELHVEQLITEGSSQLLEMIYRHFSNLTRQKK